MSLGLLDGAVPILLLPDHSWESGLGVGWRSFSYSQNASGCLLISINLMLFHIFFLFFFFFKVTTSMHLNFMLANILSLFFGLNMVLGTGEMMANKTQFPTQGVCEGLT